MRSRLLVLLRGYKVAAMVAMGSILFTTLSSLTSHAEDRKPIESSLAIERFVSIDNVCAWPNLTRLPDGTIVAIIFGKPSHGQMAGDIECWASSDGQFWEKRGRPAPNDPNTNRMNVAAGLAGNGDLLVLCSGWTDEKQPERPKQAAFRDEIIQSWVCRSSDGGRTWSQNKNFVSPDEGWTEFIPFGDIFVGARGSLHVSCYGGEYIDPTKSTKTNGYRSWHFQSDDDGMTWRRTSVIGEKHNETTLLPLGGKNWLAAARIEAMDIFRNMASAAARNGAQRDQRPSCKAPRQSSFINVRCACCRTLRCGSEAERR
jgi:BNR repeat-like domain